MIEKLYLLFPLALTPLLAATHLCANETARLEQIENQINAISQQNVEDELGGKNPSYPARPEKHPNAFFFTADFLYWRADLDGIPIAVRSKTTPGTFIDRGKMINMDFDWNPAFRVGIGGIIGEDSWDVKSEYTRYTSHTDRSVHTSGTEALIPLWASLTNMNAGGLIVNEAASHASGHYNLNYNIADVELGRSYFVSRALSVRPFIGIRGAFIYQHIRFNYSGLTFAEDGEFSPLTTKGKSNYQGGGIRGGFNLGWHFNRNWSFFSEISGSVLYGRFDARESMRTQNQSLTVNLQGDFNAARPNVELVLGLQWEAKFFKDRTRLSFGLGYEFIEWFLMNQFPRELEPGFISGNASRFHGDLGLQGGTFKARFEF